MKRARDDVGGDAFMKPMTAEEESEARRMMEIAERAERKALERQRMNQQSSQSSSSAGTSSSTVATSSSSSNSGNGKTKFLSKAEREKLALEKLQKRREEQDARSREAEDAHNRFVTGQALEEKKRRERERALEEERERERRRLAENKEEKEMDHELNAIRTHYLGGEEKKRKVLKPSEKFSKLFQFDWEEDEDTSKNDVNPLYNNRMKIHALYGRGYLAGIDQREQRKESNFLLSLSEKRVAELQRAEEMNDDLTEKEKRERAQARDRAAMALRKMHEDGNRDADLKMDKNKHWSEKELSAMTERDWRIFREDFDIRIQGGRATLPLRFWEEGGLPEKVLRGIRDAGYEKPSPIQRQSIPIGVARRDIIGIAETGSGKTASFVLPLLCNLMKLPRSQIDRVDEEGPLAVIMAPTRELAQQIEEECIKLAKHTGFLTAGIVGGQSIEEQGFKLRKGVHIVIGTPGRLCDCLQNNYLVLNQCNYVVLDEADRMVDMGFEPQVVEVLDSMGGLLKSEDEEQAEKQIASANDDSKSSGNMVLYRVTAMFSATMPNEVERIAKNYLRHPVIIKIGDEDTGKNKRIEQRIAFVTEGQKKNKIADELRRLTSQDKAIVFVNAKKQGDVVGRMLEGMNMHVGVLHGGKSQDQREETLEYFRSGEYNILVATDVAGRGLDIPDVSHVFNYDCPAKIEPYTHRIGRTGRAGKYGIATTFLTDADTEVMYDLKNYLESTNSVVPQQLARHPAAQQAAGTRDEKGNLMGQKKDSIMFSKR